MPRGRTRDEDARRRILDAAFELVGAEGSGKVRIDQIAEAAGVGKQTIYRWWPTRTAVVLDALVERTLKDTPFRSTGDCRRDFRDHLRAVVRLFTSPTGFVIREMLADAQTSAEVAAEFRERFWAPRRELSTTRLRACIADGEIREDIPIEAALDALYGPLWTRLMIGHQPMTVRTVDEILDCTWAALAR